MKVNIIDDNNIIVFLNTFKTKNIDFNNKEDIEKHFRDIFLKLKHIYGLDIKGYYNINIYIDKFYGAILEIENEALEYFDYFDDKIDMRVSIVSNTKFLYKIKDLFLLDKKLLRRVNIYSFKNKYYLLLKKDISNYEMGKLLEVSELVYGDVVEDILKLATQLTLTKV